MARRGGLGRGLGALIPPGAEIGPDVGGLEELPVAAKNGSAGGRSEHPAAAAIELDEIDVRFVDDAVAGAGGELKFSAAFREWIEGSFPGRMTGKNCGGRNEREQDGGDSSHG